MPECRVPSCRYNGLNHAGPHKEVNSDVEFWDDSTRPGYLEHRAEFYQNRKAMRAPFQPKTPCRQMETRACITVDEHSNRVLQYPVQQCRPGECARFPNLDKGAGV